VGVGADEHLVGGAAVVGQGQPEHRLPGFVRGAPDGDLLGGPAGDAGHVGVVTVAVYAGRVDTVTLADLAGGDRVRLDLGRG